ncbi:tRNA (adenosine(37)-N6)-threonylcarbamoyltransferase complex dimerization subunit type 1 TsaB [uncultured Haemophilus sp.]|uniref:tRNA (adenosine(37)-N6)-threonylcarbamoyltransferase complex dimerization subunit type 1 TsaB n=1 Tax=uncultured Haemophilus sp. TaxID=237779 RepID=UPI0028049AB9|nr:tRNA (adenosine(37)-N6)-threonylcarbamoyltransferase complex dimerization subunit type 1 TsaB [uncultured Haemophilus sp.]
MKNITLLALDTSTEACSVALWHKGEKTHLDELAQRTHTKRILPMIDELLVNSGINLKQVDALAFGRGPGSFTGVRVGAGIAQGLAFGADLPVIAVSNLTAMAQAAFELHQVENVVAAIDARMNEVYFSQVKREKVRSELGEFFQWNPVIEEQVCQPEKVLEQFSDLTAYRVGTGWAAYPQFKNSGLEGSDIILPSAQYMLELALTDYAQNKIISALEIEPVYLRNEVTWKKLPGRE